MRKKLKGNLIVVQSGGPTAVINSSIAGVIKEALTNEEIKNIYGGINGILGILKEEIIDLKKENQTTINRLKSTPSSALGSCRYKLKKQEDFERIFKVLRTHNIRYFLIAGGNDSMDTGNKIYKLAKEKKYELRVIGIPKTVDNDLVIIDHCPGYGSVARWLAIATRDAGLDTEAIYTSDTIKIIETMGRDSGWITGATCLAKERKNDAPHLIYLPEIPFNKEKFLADVERVYRRLGYCLITVCEGLKDEQGKALVESKRAVDTDDFGHAQRGGVGQYLCNLIAENLKIKARSDKPGTIQRVSMICASKIDIEEAYMTGRRAVQAAVNDYSGYMVGLIRSSDKYIWSLIPLKKVANKKKMVPRNFINREGNFVTQKFYDYVKPLIGEPLPKYARLKKILIKKHLEEYNKI